MADEGVPGGARFPASIAAVVQEVLGAVPAGCTWLEPVFDDRTRIVDYCVAAAGDQVRDIYGRGSRRRGARLSELYPSMVGGQLWKLYDEVMATGEPARLPDF